MTENKEFKKIVFQNSTNCNCNSGNCYKYHRLCEICNKPIKYNDGNWEIYKVIKGPLGSYNNLNNHKIKHYKCKQINISSNRVSQDFIKLMLENLYWKNSQFGYYCNSKDQEKLNLVKFVRLKEKGYFDH